MSLWPSQALWLPATSLLSPTPTPTLMPLMWQGWKSFKTVLPSQALHGVFRSTASEWKWFLWCEPKRPGPGWVWLLPIPYGEISYFKGSSRGVLLSVVEGGGVGKRQGAAGAGWWRGDGKACGTSDEEGGGAGQGRRGWRQLNEAAGQCLR